MNLDFDPTDLPSALFDEKRRDFMRRWHAEYLNTLKKINEEVKNGPYRFPTVFIPKQ